MTCSKYAAMAAAVAVTMSASNAFAVKQCKIVGAFTDSLGSKGTFTSQTKGTVSNSLICSSAYSLTVTKLTTKVINLRGKAKSCGNLSAQLKFQDGGCTVAKGNITVVGAGTFADTVTRSGADAAVHRAGADNSALTGGLK